MAKEKAASKENELRVVSREHFVDLLEKGQEEFRIETKVGKNNRVISEDAPFDRDDPMSYVLVKLIFDEITIFAKGEFSAHDQAEAIREYGTVTATKEQLREKLLNGLLNGVSSDDLQGMLGLIGKK